MERPNVIAPRRVLQNDMGSLQRFDGLTDPEQRAKDSRRFGARATGSQLLGFDRNRDSLGGFLLLLDAIRKHSQRERLGGRQSFFFGGAVCEDTRHIYDFGDPAAVCLALRFYLIDDMGHQRQS